MKSHSVSFVTPIRHQFASHNILARLTALTMAAAFAASQVTAQQFIVRETTTPIPTSSTQAAPSGPGSQVTPAVETVAAIPSAPVPKTEEATLAKPYSDSLISLDSLAARQDNTQSPPPAPAPATNVAKKKAPHHGLGAAMAITGSVALAAGIALVVVQDHFPCGNGNSNGCNEARDGGYAAIGVGAPVAVVGFYFLFHK